MAGLYLSIGAGPATGLSTSHRFAAEGFRDLLVARQAERLDAMARDLRRGAHAGAK